MKTSKHGQGKQQAKDDGTESSSHSVHEAKASPVAQSETEWHNQLTEDRVGRVDTEGPGSHPVGAISSANSVSADPFARQKALGEPVPQVTRHI